MEIKATELRDNIFDIDRTLHALSEKIAKDIDWDGIDPVYLKSKFTAIENTVKHIKGQLKYKR
jgi:hypothetical protein